LAIGAGAKRPKSQKFNLRKPNRRGFISIVLTTIDSASEVTEIGNQTCKTKKARHSVKEKSAISDSDCQGHLLRYSDFLKQTRQMGCARQDVDSCVNSTHDAVTAAR